MGRIKKYMTKEEKYEAQKRWVMEYYWKNKEMIKEKNLKRYHEKNRNL